MPVGATTPVSPVLAHTPTQGNSAPNRRWRTGDDGGGESGACGYLFRPIQAARKHFGGWKRIETKNASLTR